MITNLRNPTAVGATGHDENATPNVAMHYRCPVQMYDRPPQEIIGIHEFQQVAISRLQVLKKIQFLYDSNKDAQSDLMACEINKFTKQHKLNVEGTYDSMNKRFAMQQKTRFDCEEAKNDNISHFICRLAYCRNEDLRRWFVQQESRLFFYRTEACDPNQILDLLQSKCQMRYERLHREHKDWAKLKESITFNLDNQLRRGKQQTTKKPQAANVNVEDHASDFIKVPFKDALNLVAQRQVFLHKGFAYVHVSDLNQIARTQFKNAQFSELNRAFKFLPTILQD